jgi:C-terminal processing protease CtpA/Prc
VPTAKLTKKQKRVRRLEGIRSLQIDLKEKQALLRINSFSQNGRLRSFFRKGFKLLDQNNIEDLIIDVRNNGGGRVGNSTALTRYVTDRRFKIADSLYAVRRNSSYGKYIEHNLAIQASMPFLTRKRKDGLHHFGYFERHFFTPKKNNRFSGRVYILTGGNSFSATTLFVQAVRGQKNVTVIGEETGGGAYGNSAWEIPDVTLPHTGVRFRLPLFRMVMNKEIPNDGRGILPDVYVGSTVESVRRNIDNKMQVAVQLIQEIRRKE